MSSAPASTPLRVLVVDDSHYNRQIISDALAASPDITVVGHASNGEQALRMVAELEPDAITLDVEMPKMDGFTFLRILMRKRPTAVVVISSLRTPENVFRALELGALDFVSKPDSVAETRRWQDELREKINLVRFTDARRIAARTLLRASPPDRRSNPGFPMSILGIAASTGGPGAILHILSRLPSTHAGAILIAQHMAASFTRSFAERLDRTSTLTVREAIDGEPVQAGHVYVCPGGSCMELRSIANFPMGLRIALGPPQPTDRYVPNANRMLTSIAQVMGPRSVALILTGMADDGVEGARAVRRAGGTVVAESEETAIINGMPGAVIREGLAHKILPLHEIPEEILYSR